MVKFGVGMDKPEPRVVDARRTRRVSMISYSMVMAMG